MGKPGFELRVRKQIFPVSGKPNSKAEAIVRRKIITKIDCYFEGLLLSLVTVFERNYFIFRCAFGIAT